MKIKSLVLCVAATLGVTACGGDSGSAPLVRNIEVSFDVETPKFEGFDDEVKVFKRGYTVCFFDESGVKECEEGIDISNPIKLYSVTGDAKITAVRYERHNSYSNQCTENREFDGYVATCALLQGVTNITGKADEATVLLKNEKYGLVSYQSSEAQKGLYSDVIINGSLSRGSSDYPVNLYVKKEYQIQVDAQSGSYRLENVEINSGELHKYDEAGRMANTTN
ncbi:hypothetical protein JQC92_01235 [Shewanella sp. 202IG2-18]|uniref:hypothetical protein n=1 Tax=Parashewanella hymeniacidonis TaxID=2807618 RepID=UPI001961B386|nr:hypothetical protein [Parashewanella hymeniacidonis]MBM7070666.1 hypothetical protein [Parashewanella hymeniacidonis]